MFIVPRVSDLTDCRMVTLRTVHTTIALFEILQFYLRFKLMVTIRAFKIIQHNYSFCAHGSDSSTSCFFFVFLFWASICTWSIDT
jgi:hypothetical protein